MALGVIGLLIAVLAPTLRGARGTALERLSQSNLRSLGQTLELYTNANGSMFPFPPRAPLQPAFGPLYATPPDEAGASLSFFFSPVWSMSVFWPMTLHDAAPWREHYSTWLSPGHATADGAPPWTIGKESLYEYSNSFLASPRVWSGRGAVESDVQPVRTASVQFPSGKVVMIDGARSYSKSLSPAAWRPLLMADGAAALRRDSEASAGVANPLNGGSTSRYHNTRDGVAGRDF